MTDLDLRPYAPAIAEDVVAVYNRAIAGWPYCAGLDVDYFTTQIVPRFFFEPEGLIVAYRGGRPVGYVHASGTPSADRQGIQRDLGSISALFAPTGEPAAAAALLGAAEQWLVAQGATRIVGWGGNAGGYPFYRGLLCGLEPVLPQANAVALEAFRAAGYVPYFTSHLLVADLAAPYPEPSTAIPVDVAVAARRHPGRWDEDAWRGHSPRECRAAAGGEVAGTLVFAAMPRLSATAGMTLGGIAALGVREPFRRKGIATLLNARALNALYHAGIRRVLVGCRQDNAAALGTYYKFGFRPEATLIAMGSS
jgi:ribosomal protein S18 acetylase RimI-like enzyme